MMKNNMDGFTKKAAMEIPLLKRLIKENSDIAFRINKNLNMDFSYAMGNITKSSYSVNIGAKGASKAKIISTALHELGHVRVFNNADSIINAERKAWRFARKYAKQHNYPFDDLLMKSSIATWTETYRICRGLIKNLSKEISENKDIFNKAIEFAVRDYVWMSVGNVIKSA